MRSKKALPDDGPSSWPGFARTIRRVLRSFRSLGSFFASLTALGFARTALRLSDFCFLLGLIGSGAA